MNKIPAGYRFTFVSHDLHNENIHTIILEGIDEIKANLFVDLCELIKYGTGIELEDTLEWRKNKFHEKSIHIFEKYTNIFTNEQLIEFKQDLGLVIDFISENILGYSYDNNVLMRVLSYYKVEDIPEDIIINDVTQRFNKKNKT